MSPISKGVEGEAFIIQFWVLPGELELVTQRIWIRFNPLSPLFMFLFVKKASRVLLFLGRKGFVGTL